MSKLLTKLLLGAAAGTVAGAVIHKAQERAEAGQPVIPSALLAVAAGLDPLLKGGLLYARTTIDNILAAGDHPEHDTLENIGNQLDSLRDMVYGDTSDGGDAAPDDAKQPPVATEVHPAGPEFAPTPA